MASTLDPAIDGEQNAALKVGSGADALPLPQRLTVMLRWWRYVSVMLMGFGVAFILSLTLGAQYKYYSFSHNPDLWLQAFVQSSVALIGIRYINFGLDKRYPWNRNLKKRFWRQASLNLSYVLVTMLVMQAVFALLRWLILGRGFVSLQDEMMMTFVFVSLTFVVVLVDWGLFLLGSWRKSEAMSERYRKERVEFQFEMLRNQVNPHFLFNNLNTISSLVHDQPEVATEFVKQLSKVYRYLLEYQAREVISLKEEEQFLNAYIYLIRMRFGQNILIELDLPQAFAQYQVVPVCLQMLVENALKHNIASRNKPLRLRIFVEDEGPYLVVTNNYQPKTSTEFSSRIGLVNIKSRYQFLTSQQVVITKDDASYMVKLPLLHPYENLNRRR